MSTHGHCGRTESRLKLSSCTHYTIIEPSTKQLPLTNISQRISAYSDQFPRFQTCGAREQKKTCPAKSIYPTMTTGQSVFTMTTGQSCGGQSQATSCVGQRQKIRGSQTCRFIRLARLSARDNALHCVFLSDLEKSSLSLSVCVCVCVCASALLSHQKRLWFVVVVCERETDRERTWLR